ncbi:putative ribonuclease H-like domain-containing protein [Tanacetum coccineum]
MPPLADLYFSGLDDSVYRLTANKTSASVSQVETSITPPSNTSIEMPRVESVRPSGVIIEDWVSDHDEDIFQSNDSQTTVKPSFIKIEFTKARNEPVKFDKQAIKHRMVTQYPKVDKKDWNGKMTQKIGLEFGSTKKTCFVCGSYSHLIKDCDFHEKRMTKKSVLQSMGKGTSHREVRPIWNNTQRINHQNKFVSSAILTRFGRIPISTAKQFENGTDSKNREMDEFCGQKGIKREYSVARTPQQNGVAKRKNRTLIEAARTMLADSLLPTVFWAEAVNTACYAPSISFMRPFGCPVTILNTLDPLGKFDGKAEEGFLVGYSVNSKAFRVFNSQTRKVEENLHVNFLENKPNVAGQGPNWLFDIDSLTNSMNYQPVTAGNQTNKNAGPQEANGNTGLKQSVDAGQSEEKNVSTQQYVVFPLWSSISSSYKSSDDKAEDDTVDDDACKKTIQEPASEYDQALKNVLDKMMDQEKEATEQSDAVRKEFEAQCDSQLLQEKITRASSTNSFNTVSTPVNTASASRTFSPIGPSSGPSFVPFGGSFPIDVANLPHDPLMPELEDTAEIRSTGIFGNAYISQALYDERLVKAMQEEELASVQGFKKVWTQIYFLVGKKGFVDPEFLEKVYKVEKALYGLHQAPRAWYETLSTYLLDNGFHRGQIDKTLFIKRLKGDILLVQVYVDDIIFGSTKKSLCDEFEQIMHNRFQMSSMGELTFFLGLQVKQKEDGIFISQDKYVGEILKKFGFSSIRTASTPMETNKALTKDEDGEDVDVHLYRSMIGSLMYLTSSRPDIMFSVCACSRFQVQPKVSHLNAVKRIFRYLKGQPKLGLWYPKDSPLILEAFSDSDYAGASLDRKSTTGGCQFLCSRLISWQCKKQTVVANSTTEAEYITKIHVDNESAICVVKNPVYHSKTKHIEIRHHFIRDSYEKRLIEMVKIHTDNNVADLLTKAFDVSRFNFLVASIGKKGWDTKIPQSSGPPIKVGDEAIHKELGYRMEKPATTASSFEAEQDSGSGPRCQETTLGM